MEHPAAARQGVTILASRARLKNSTAQSINGAERTSARDPSAGWIFSSSARTNTELRSTRLPDSHPSKSCLDAFRSSCSLAASLMPNLRPSLGRNLSSEGSQCWVEILKQCTHCTTEGRIKANRSQGQEGEIYAQAHSRTPTRLLLCKKDWCHRMAGNSYRETGGELHRVPGKGNKKFFFHHFFWSSPKEWQQNYLFKENENHQICWSITSIRIGSIGAPHGSAFGPARIGTST